MQLKQLLTEDDAVSPVIGVILMVAITVILAAVIAAFVLGLGDTNEAAPNPTFDFDYDEDTKVLEVRVTGGDTFSAEQVEFQGNLDDSDVSEGTSWADIPEATTTRVSAGDSVTLTIDDPSDENEWIVDIVWTSEDGDNSQTLVTRTGADR